MAISKTLNVVKGITNVVEYAFPEKAVDKIALLGQKIVGGENAGMNIIQRLENAALVRAIEKTQKQTLKHAKKHHIESDKLLEARPLDLSEYTNRPRNLDLYDVGAWNYEDLMRENVLIKCLDPDFVLKPEQQRAILYAAALQLPADMVKSIADGCHQGLGGDSVMQLAKSWAGGHLDKESWYELFHASLSLGLKPDVIRAFGDGLATGMYSPAWISACLRSNYDAEMISQKTQMDRSATLNILDIDLATEDETFDHPQAIFAARANKPFWHKDQEESQNLDLCGNARHAYCTIHIGTWLGEFYEGERITVGDQTFTVTEVLPDHTAKAVSDEPFVESKFYDVEITKKDVGPHGDYDAVEYRRDGELIYGWSNFLWEYKNMPKPHISYEDSDIRKMLEDTVLPDLKKALVKQSIEFTGMDILSVKDVKESKDLIPDCDERCWLQDTANTNRGELSYMAGKNIGGIDSPAEKLGVRPQLFFNPESAYLPEGTDVPININGEEHTFRVIEPGRMIALEPVTYMGYSDTLTSYDKSDIKKELDKMFEDIQMSIGRYAAKETYEVVAGVSDREDRSSKKKADLKITSVDIITVDEYKKVKDLLPGVNWSWMTRTYSDGWRHSGVVMIHSSGTLLEDVKELTESVEQRPIVTFKSSEELTPGTQVRVNGIDFTVIGDGRMITNELVLAHSFDGERMHPSATFTGSSLEQYLNGWLKDTFEHSKNIVPELDIEFTGATLLSASEYGLCQDIVPTVKDSWWLRTPGRHEDSAEYVSTYGQVNYYGNTVYHNDCSIRPALIFNPESCDLSVGDHIKVGNNWYTVINENMMLCDEILVHDVPFKDGMPGNVTNDYDYSDVKMTLNGWFAREIWTKHAPQTKGKTEIEAEDIDTDEHEL